jgi:hypothetical protein
VAILVDGLADETEQLEDRRDFYIKITHYFLVGHDYFLICNVVLQFFKTMKIDQSNAPTIKRASGRPPKTSHSPNPFSMKLPGFSLIFTFCGHTIFIIFLHVCLYHLHGIGDGQDFFCPDKVVNVKLHGI